MGHRPDGRETVPAPWDKNINREEPHRARMGALTWVGNDRTHKIEVRPDYRTSPLMTGTNSGVRILAHEHDETRDIVYV